MGGLKHDAAIDVGEPFSPKPDARVPATLIRAKEEKRLVVVLRRSGDRLRGQACLRLKPDFLCRRRGYRARPAPALPEIVPSGARGSRTEGWGLPVRTSDGPDVRWLTMV